MRTMIRTVLLALLAAFAASAVASASASAAECPDTVEGGDVALCKGGVEQEGAFPFTGKKKPATVATFTFTAGPITECKMAVSGGQFAAGAEDGLQISKLVLTLSECEIVNTASSKANCEVKPIELNGASSEGLRGTFTGAEPAAVTWQPASGETLAFITVKTRPGKPSCVYAINNGALTGKQSCKLADSQEERATHVMECQGSGSTLEFRERSAKLELKEEVTLNAGGSWSLQKS